MTSPHPRPLSDWYLFAVIKLGVNRYSRMVIFQEDNISVVLKKIGMYIYENQHHMTTSYVDISLQRYLNEVVDIIEVGGSLLLHLLLLYRSSIHLHLHLLYLAPAPP